MNDCSENGLLVKCNQDISIGAVVDIELFMPDKSTSLLKGVVRRKIDMPESNRKYGLGIELIKKDVRYSIFSVSNIDKSKTKTAQMAD